MVIADKYSFKKYSTIIDIIKMTWYILKSIIIVKYAIIYMWVPTRTYPNSYLNFFFTFRL